MHITDRQWPLTAVFEIVPDEETVTANLPPGALVTGVTGYRAVAFDTGGGTPVATVAVSDGTTTFVNDQNLMGAAGALTVAVTDKYYPSGGTLTATVTQSAASALVEATAGLSLITVSYVIRGKGREVQI